MSALTRIACLVLGHRPGAPVQQHTVRIVHPLGGTVQHVPVVARKWTCTRCKRVVREDRVEPYADIGDDE